MKEMNGMVVTKLSSGVLLLLAVFTFPVFSQAEDTDLAKQRAKEVIAEYLKATGFGESASARTYIHITFREIRPVSSNYGTSEYETQEEYSLSLPDKMRRYVQGGGASFLSLLNQTSYQMKHEVLETNSQSNVTVVNPPPQSKNRKVNLTKEEQRKDNDVRRLKWKSFLVFFPIIMEAPWYKKIAFKHIGIAESSIGKAHVLEADFDGKFNYQLLFDTKSHLLLVYKIISSSEDDEDIFYFSDYKKINGFLIAHTVKKYENEEWKHTKKVTGFNNDRKFVLGLFEKE